MATIRKKGEYQWHVQIRKRGFPVQTKTFSYRTDAEAWAKVIESEMERGIFLSRHESARTTIADLIDRYMKEVTPSKKNWKSETEILQRVKNRFGALFLASLNSQRDELQASGKAASTINHYLNALSVVVDTAMREWSCVLPSNPVRLVKRPPQPKGRERRLLPGEEKRILRECRRYKNPVLEPLVRLALETAMRQGELFALLWENIDLAKCTAMLPETKNGEARTVPLSTEAVRILNGLKTVKGVPRLQRGKVFRANIAATRIAFTRAVERARLRYESACSRLQREPDVPGRPDVPRSTP